MKLFISIICMMILSFFSSVAFAMTATTEPIPLAEIKGYDQYPKIVKQLILEASKLSKMHLTYLYGSSDPINKGMDCSGTIYYLLKQTKIKNENFPRESDQMFFWVEKKGKLYKINHANFQSKDFSQLKPGDLLFWSGTYPSHRASPITHVMLYLGKNEKDEPLMFGASNGRTYKHKKMWGVSVFDFILPKHGPQKFVGYSCIPNLTCDI